MHYMRYHFIIVFKKDIDQGTKDSKCIYQISEKISNCKSLKQIKLTSTSNSKIYGPFSNSELAGQLYNRLLKPMY